MLSKAQLKKVIRQDRYMRLSSNGWATPIIETEIEDSYSPIRASIWRQVNCKISFLTSITVKEARNPSDEIDAALNTAASWIFNELYADIASRLGQIYTMMNYSTMEVTKQQINELYKDLLGEEK